MILHHLFDANVFDDVEDVERTVRQKLFKFSDTFIGGVKGMTDFVAYQKVRHRLVRDVPCWKAEDSILHVEEGRRVVAGLDGDVLLGEEFCQNTLGGGVDEWSGFKHDRILPCSGTNVHALFHYFFDDDNQSLKKDWTNAFLISNLQAVHFQQNCV